MSVLETNPSFGDPQPDGERKTTSIEKLPRLSCKNYGFDCSFSISNKNVSKLIRDFRDHTIETHFIDYPEGVLMRLILRKRFD